MNESEITNLRHVTNLFNYRSIGNLNFKKSEAKIKIKR